MRDETEVPGVREAVLVRLSAALEVQAGKGVPVQLGMPEKVGRKKGSKRDEDTDGGREADGLRDGAEGRKPGAVPEAAGRDERDDQLGHGAEMGAG